MQSTGTDGVCQLVSSGALAPGGGEGAGLEEARPPYLETPAQNCGQSPYGAVGHVPKFVELDGQRMPVESVAYCVTPHRCRSRFCPQCGPKDGRRLRKLVNQVVESFTNVQMWTFTVDPSLFPSPEAAFRYVRSKRCIAELVRVLRDKGCLHSDRWFYVLEFHESGWPHWHLLVDASFVPFDTVSAVWNRFRPSAAGPVEGNRPGFGAVRFSAPKFQSKAHAANYATKYVIKTPDQGWPAWVLTFKGRIKRYGVSRGFWDVLESDQAESSGDSGDVLEESAAASAAARRMEAHKPECFCEVCRGDATSRTQQATVGERVANCGRGCSLMEVLTAVDRDGNGHQVWRWFCDVGSEYGGALEYLGIEVPELPKCVFVSADEVVRLEKMFRPGGGDGFETWVERYGWYDIVAWYNSNRGRAAPVEPKGDTWRAAGVFGEDDAEC